MFEAFQPLKTLQGEKKMRSEVMKVAFLLRALAFGNHVQFSSYGLNCVALGGGIHL